jgi:hypothetical protein
VAGRRESHLQQSNALPYSNLGATPTTASSGGKMRGCNAWMDYVPIKLYQMLLSSHTQEILDFEKLYLCLHSMCKKIKQFQYKNIQRIFCIKLSIKN